MNIIVAVDKNWGIGKDNNLLFHIPDDLKHFRILTENKVVIMGKNTFLSLQKPLNNRTNIVVSSKANYSGVINIHNNQELKEVIQKFKTDDIFVIGGASIYNLLIDYCKYVYITKIDSLKNADTYFVDLDALNNWRLMDTSNDNIYKNITYKFCVYENIKVKDISKL